MKIHASLISALFTLCLPGCDEPDPDRQAAAEDDALRGPLGKADAASGSCAAVDDDGPACGGPAPVGACWCDDACIDFGDCCHDAFDACGVGEPPPEPAVSQCLADAHCEAGQTCAGGVCIEIEPEPEPEPEPDCDDGSSLSPFCDIKPLCEAGQVAAVIGACFQCVDADTCEPPAPAPTCGDGSSLSPFCDVPPLCPAGTDKFIVSSCFQCLDPATCEPAA